METEEFWNTDFHTEKVKKDEIHFFFTKGKIFLIKKRLVVNKAL